MTPFESVSFISAILGRAVFASGLKPERATYSDKASEKEPWFPLCLRSCPVGETDPTPATVRSGLVFGFSQPRIVGVSWQNVHLTPVVAGAHATPR